jgi:UDP-GlcNAc:undecaprenyl-phosphate/decaprenyl-phosphate GlcNAc-1-phosphate transferase
MEIAPIIAIVAAAALSSLLVTLALTALVRVVARWIGMVDHPDGHRKLHRRATPQGGGVAVFLATAGVLAVLFVVPNPCREALRMSSGSLLGLLLAGFVIVATGVVDDIKKLRGRQKLFMQCVAASVIMASGLAIENVVVFGNVINLGLLAVPLTLFWLLGAINSVNLLDGIDGLATTVGIILAATLGAMAMIPLAAEGPAINPENYATMIVAMVFTGSLVGFLRFNFPPASVFLGDSGSMLIGLVVGSLAILGSFKGPGTVLLAAPLAVWTIPILDSAAAVLRRRLSGRSIYVTDRAHLHHRLLNLLGSNRKVLGVIAVCCAFTSVAALVSVYLKADLIAMLSAVAVVVVFIVTGMFGRAELLLLTSRLRHVGHSLIANNGHGKSSVTETSVRLQGSLKWELLWATLTEAADSLSFKKIHLDLNIPAAQEGYTATWTRSAADDPRLSWQIDIPLIVSNKPAGHLQIVCACNGKSLCEQIEQLLILLEPFEDDFRLLTEDNSTVHDSAHAQKRTSRPRHSGRDVLTSDN